MPRVLVVQWPESDHDDAEVHAESERSLIEQLMASGDASSVAMDAGFVRSLNAYQASHLGAPVWIVLPVEGKRGSNNLRVGRFDGET